MRQKLNQENSKDSLGEDSWSRGSLAELIGHRSLTPILSTEQHKVIEKPKLYRYELGGTIVYNSKARIVGDNLIKDFPVKREYNSQGFDLVKKSLEKIDSKGNFLTR